MVNGKKERPTGMACAQARRARANIPVLGITAMRCPVFIRGPAGILTRVNGRTGSATDWASNIEDGGFTLANGPKDSAGVTVYGCAKIPKRNMKELGRTVYKMVMERRLMQMEVS